MSQPKLSNQNIEALLTVGPLAGLDVSTDPYYVDAPLVIDLLNYVPNHRYKALCPIRGRLANNVPAENTPTVLGLTTYQGQPAVILCTSDGTIQYAAFTNWANVIAWTMIGLPTFVGTPSGKQGQFSSYSSWTFFSNGNNTGLAYKFDKNLAATMWQIAPPPSAPAFALTSPSNGLIFGSTYYWRYTYSNASTTTTDLAQESSPSDPIGPQDVGAGLGPPNSNTANVTQTAAPTLAVSATAGTMAADTYFIGTTWILATGETALSVLASITLAATHAVDVTPVNPPAGALGFNIYTGLNTTQLVRQGPSRTGTGTGTELNYVGPGGPAPTTGQQEGPPPPVYSPQVDPPPAPSLTAVAGGSLPARTEYYVITYYVIGHSNQETTQSAEASIDVPANQLVVVSPPPAPPANEIGYNQYGYKIYGSQTSTEEILVTTVPNLTASYTEATTGLVLGQSAVLTIVGSSDPQVAEINIYRIGGALGNWFFVGSMANAPGPQTYTDNLPDASVTGQAMVLHRDAPPPFYSIFSHVDRMMGFGWPAYTDLNEHAQPEGRSLLGYSNYNEPWGFDTTNQILPVGADNRHDTAVCGAALSSIGILWKKQTTWALYGQSPSDFFVQKLFDIGATSLLGCGVFLGTAFWLSNQGIYMFDGSTLSYISQDVKAILDTFAASDFASAAIAFDDRIVWWSFPNQGISLGYDTVGQRWWKSNLVAAAFACDTEGVSRPKAVDYVFGARADTSNCVDQWFAATTDLGDPIMASLTSRLANSGPKEGTLRVRYIELIASSGIADGDSVTVTVTTNPNNSAPHTFSKTFGASINARQLASTPAGLQGQVLDVQVASTSSDALAIQGASVFGWLRRLYNVVA